MRKQHPAQTQGQPMAVSAAIPLPPSASGSLLKGHIRLSSLLDSPAFLALCPYHFYTPFRAPDSVGSNSHHYSQISFVSLSCQRFLASIPFHHSSTISEREHTKASTAAFSLRLPFLFPPTYLPCMIEIPPTTCFPFVSFVSFALIS